MAWASSGAMWLTGQRHGPPSAAPAQVAEALVAAADDLAQQTARWGRTVVVDGPALMGERAALTGMSRNGDTSVGGSARFVQQLMVGSFSTFPGPKMLSRFPLLLANR